MSVDFKIGVTVVCCNKRFATVIESMNHVCVSEYEYPVKEMCTCEHTNHFNDHLGPQIGHEYGKVPAGSKSAYFVGPICDDCSINCMANYLI